MKHLMIDIETLGVKSHSVILSIAAVEFDLKTGETGRHFYKKIDIDSCLSAGLKVSGSTLKWWMRQEKQAKKEAFSDDSEQLLDVLIAFSEFISDNDYETWGNSNRFDLEKIENAYDYFNIKTPWKFWNERDCRTLRSLMPNILNEIDFEGTPHNPLDDCYFQIKYCSEIFKKLKL